MADLLVNLYQLEECDKKKVEAEGITVVRALIPDKSRILHFVKEYYPGGWEHECEYALFRSPISCFVAMKGKEILGFSCYDATAKGYFGPIGMKPGLKGKGVGKVLLFETLKAMKEAGYGYAIIGWVGEEPMPFYRRCLGDSMLEIPNSSEEQTIYSRLASLHGR